MNKYKYFAIAVTSIWFSSALAISVSLYFTKNMKSLWFLIIPLLVNVKIGEKEGTRI